MNEYILRQMVRELVERARKFGSKKEGLPREKQWYSVTLRGSDLDALRELAGDSVCELHIIKDPSVPIGTVEFRDGAGTLLGRIISCGDNQTDLKEAVEASRQALKESEWVQMDDPETELMKLRHGPDWVPSN